MKKIPLFIMLILFLFLTALSAAADEARLPSGTSYSQIGQKIQDYVKEHEKTSAGMATAVFDKDGTIYQGNFGYMNKEKGVKADDDSVFEWGSVTKLTVWLSVMQLWEEGKIDLEEDIRTYLPDGFLKTLRYEKPITMLDLMNHQAGFEESAAAMNSGSLSMEEILATKQPAQLFEPGTMTAYSNFSTSLAAYVVEQIFGQNFADYVHEHIFEPLSMDKTSILPDYKDNDYVLQKRKKELTYNTEGQVLGANYTSSVLYPSGQAAGTMGDFQKFAQALLKRDKLFKRQETWTRLYTASSTYPDTDMPLNMHGFWTQEYGTTVVGHGGNSIGFSSNILLDLKHGVGYVVMTNQAQEKIYNQEMPELIFGAKKKTDKTAFENFQPGFYRKARYYATGPLSITRGLSNYTNYVPKSVDNPLLNKDYAVLGHTNGLETVTQEYGDSYKINAAEAYKDYAMYILFLAGLVYALVNLIISGIANLVRLVRKVPTKVPVDLKIWNYLTSLVILAVAFNFYLIFTALSTSQTAIVQPWRYMVFAGIGVILAVSAVYPLVSKAKKRLGKGRLFLTGLTSLAALAIVANILYWSLYQWWVL